MLVQDSGTCYVPIILLFRLDHDSASGIVFWTQKDTELAPDFLSKRLYHSVALHDVTFHSVELGGLSHLVVCSLQIFIFMNVHFPPNLDHVMPHSMYELVPDLRDGVLSCLVNVRNSYSTLTTADSRTACWFASRVCRR